MINILIYLIAVTVFMIQCFIMIFIYLTEKTPYKHNLTATPRYPVPNNGFFYFILIPCLNEGKVIQNTLQNVLRLSGQKHIIVIDDNSDDDTIQQIRAIHGPISTIERRPPRARTGKGDSLNSAMPLIRVLIHEYHLDPSKSIVGVIDADGVLSKNSIEKLDQVFSNPNNDAVQLRVKMKTPRRILQIFQDIEFFTINHLIQLFRTHLNAVALCGNAQFFRYSSVTQKLGTAPWGNSLLEDYEMTLRMELTGIKIKYVWDAHVDQEALWSVKKLIVQRSRWSQGGFNCWKYFKAIVKSKQMNLSQKLDAYFFFFNPILNLLADFSIIFLTISFFTHNLSDPIFLFAAFVILATFGFFFGALFTIIYLHQLKLLRRNQQFVNILEKSTLRMNSRKLFLAIGLISYIYVILFFSIIIAIYHEALGVQSWSKTKRN